MNWTPLQATNALQSSVSNVIEGLKAELDAMVPGMHETIARKISVGYSGGGPDALARLQSSLFNEMARVFERIAEELRK